MILTSPSPAKPEEGRIPQTWRSINRTYVHTFNYYATRHPWPVLLMLLPLLVAHEAGVLAGGPRRNPSATRGRLLRAAILRLSQIVVASARGPQLRRLGGCAKRRPRGLFTVCTGGARVLCLRRRAWGLSTACPFLNYLGVTLSTPGCDPVYARITYVGAGHLRGNPSASCSFRGWPFC